MAVMFFGALTLIFQDETFIKIKPTVVSLIVALALIIFQAIGRQPLKLIMSSGIKLTDIGWKYLIGSSSIDPEKFYNIYKQL